MDRFLVEKIEVESIEDLQDTLNSEYYKEYKLVSCTGVFRLTYMLIWEKKTYWKTMEGILTSEMNPNK